MGQGWVDSHTHVHDAEAVAAAAAAGVTGMVAVGTDVASSRDTVASAARHPGVVWATAGVHPHEARHGLDGLADLLVAHAGREIVAVGECGLDYHYDHSPRDVQQAVFAEQVELAHQYDLALVIHTREAWDDTFAVLDEASGAGRSPGRIVFHCFTGGPAEARAALDRGAALSFSGIVTFKGADEVRAAAALCPPDQLLVETDSPYLTPAPHRGRPNHPAHVADVGAGLAAARQQHCQEVEVLTAANARRLLQLHSSDPSV